MKPSLTNINRVFWPLLITPLSILCYYQLIRFVLLRAYRNGEPYTNSQGEWIERDFSANQCALIDALLFAAATLFFGIRALRAVRRRALRIVLTVAECFWALLGIVLFLEFSLWS